jgi:hypothetical protein
MIESFVYVFKQGVIDCLIHISQEEKSGLDAYGLPTEPSYAPEIYLLIAKVESTDVTDLLSESIIEDIKDKFLEGKRQKNDIF